MPIHKIADSQTDSATPDVQADTATPAKQAQFTDDGQIPQVGGDAKTAGPTASDRAFDADVNGGMHDPAAYKAACEAAGKTDKWSDKYYAGHTAATQWIQPYEGRYAMAFQLKKGSSASQAVKDFLKGPTIADYRVRGVALEMDELRDNIGDHTFDRYFGSRDSEHDATIPMAQRLSITSAMYTIPFADQMQQIVDDGETRHVAVADEPEVEAPESRERVEKPKVEEEPVVVADAGQQAQREVV